MAKKKLPQPNNVWVFDPTRAVGWDFDLTDAEIEIVASERAIERLMSPRHLGELSNPALFHRILFLHYVAQRGRDVN